MGSFHRPFKLTYDFDSRRQQTVFLHMVYYQLVWYYTFLIHINLEHSLIHIDFSVHLPFRDSEPKSVWRQIVILLASWMRGFVKEWFNLVSSQSRDLLFSETCWVNAISRSKYCENGVSAKVALTIFNDTMWVKSFLMLVLNSTGSKMVLETRSNTFASLTAMKCNRVFCYFFS